MKILIHGSKLVPKELLAGMTGWGSGFIQKPKTALYAPSELDLITKEELNRFQCFSDTAYPTYQETYFKFKYNRTILRSVITNVAIDLYNAILEQPIPHESLQIVGLSHGGTIGLLLTDIIRVGARKSAGIDNFKDLDPEVVAQKDKIKASNTIKSIVLITIGTPVSYESNAIMQRNVVDPQHLVTKHLHLFSEGDRVATLDPGLASRYWHGILSHGLKRKFAPPTNNKQGRFQQMKISNLTNVDKKLINNPGHKDLIKNIGPDDISLFLEILNMNPTKTFFQAINGKPISTDDNLPVKFSNSIFRQKRFVSIAAILSCSLILLKKNTYVKFFRLFIGKK